MLVIRLGLYVCCFETGLVCTAFITFDWTWGILHSHPCEDSVRPCLGWVHNKASRMPLYGSHDFREILKDELGFWTFLNGYVKDSGPFPQCCNLAIYFISSTLNESSACTVLINFMLYHELLRCLSCWRRILMQKCSELHLSAFVRRVLLSLLLLVHGFTEQLRTGCQQIDGTWTISNHTQSSWITCARSSLRNVYYKKTFTRQCHCAKDVCVVRRWIPTIGSPFSPSKAWWSCICQMCGWKMPLSGIFIRLIYNDMASSVVYIMLFHELDRFRLQEPFRGKFLALCIRREGTSLENDQNIWNTSTSLQLPNDLFGREFDATRIDDAEAACNHLEMTLATAKKKMLT